MKKASQTTTIEVEDHDDLPEGWELCGMEDISDLVTSGSRDWSQFYSNRGAYFVRSAEINDYTLRIAEAIRVALPARVEGKRSLIEKDDILVTITGANVGKCAKVDTVIPEAYVSQSVALIKLKQKNLAPFVYYAMRAPNFAGRQLTDMAYGVGRPVLSLPQIKSLLIPLAPLIEQHRIVEQIEDLLSRVGATNQRLAKVHKILKAFRQSVLAAARSGRLTDDWREKHPCVEIAAQFLTRIRATRRTVWEDVELAKMLSKGTVPKTEKWKVKYIEPADPEVDDTPELPETWCLAGLEVLLSTNRRGIKTGPFGSSLNKQEHQASGIPVLGIENIGEMKFIEGSKIHISSAKAEELAEFDALPDDILISRSGTVGEVCVVPHGLGEARIPTNIMRVTLQGGSMLPTYFCYLFNGSPFVLRQIDQLCGGSSRDFLNQRILMSLLFPLPPLDEQHEIVRRVGALFKLADAIEKRVAAATNRADKLTQAILAKAFRGELVPTEAELARKEGRTYEPASELLSVFGMEVRSHMKAFGLAV